MLDLSLVIPIKNESENVVRLIDEIGHICQGKGFTFEVVCVDDGSTDQTVRCVANLQKNYPWLRIVSHPRSYGQSAAIRTGVIWAHGELVMTLDGDGQNDPAYIPLFFKRWKEAKGSLGLVAGQRVGRAETSWKRLQSRIANNIRSSLLKDSARDTGCGLKLLPRALFLQLPYFDGLHRFLPALVKREGRDILYLDVQDRRRFSGRSHYTAGNRLWVGLGDMFMVFWLMKRYRPVSSCHEGENNV
jgi:glycosyltransferase involved in cell wall biosynthesis